MSALVALALAAPLALQGAGSATPCALAASCTTSLGATPAEPVRLAAAFAQDVATPESAGAAAAEPASGHAGQQTAAAPASGYDTDLDADPAEPDFTVIDLPTNLRLPKHKLAFRLTHRFARPLGEGSFSDLLADFFGFDGGAQVGFGLRFGLFRGTQLGIYRTGDRTIVLHAQQELLREGKAPLGLSLVGSVDGLDNFGLSDAPPGQTLHTFAPALGLLLSRRLGARGAVYAMPSWVGHTRVNPSAPGSEDGTLLLGVGARLRVTKVMSLLGEVHPRLGGYAGDVGSGNPDALATFGVEWTVGGHAFQLNFSNALATTPGQIARGAQGQSGWFIGFNLTRKFY